MSRQPDTDANELGPILYAGSVKNVRAYGGVESEELCFEFTDRYSVFDWGEMPQRIPGKGQALAVIGAVLFERLSDPALWRSFLERQFPQHWTQRLPREWSTVLDRLGQKGLRTHYRGLVGPEGTRVSSWKALTGAPRAMVVQKLEIQHPRMTDSGYVYETHPTPLARLVPLEVVFRHRLTEGSSILERRSELLPGMRFDEPLIEFFTKLEPRDRFLTPEEAIEVSGLDSGKLLELEILTKATAGILAQWFAEEHLELVDGKLEWAITPEGEFMLVDAIGPDELRIETRDEVEISKEVFRRFYRNTRWYREMKAVKAAIDSSGETVENWQLQVKSAPPHAPERIIRGFAGCLHALSARLAKRDFFGSARLEKVASELTVDPARLRHGKVLLIGNGGREHALAWKILQSPQVESLHWYPGNEAAIDLLTRDHRKEVIRVSEVKHDPAAVADYARSEGIELVVIGPDQFLADGWTDVLTEKGLRVFGPSRAAARLEWSKSFSKEVLNAARVPTAASYLAKTENELRERLLALSWSGGKKWVFKADGLALGKGVKICSDADDALQFGRGWISQGHAVLIEEFLIGEELSWFAFCDGESCALLDPARDYKTLHDGGMGPNTGGMGAISPVPGIGAEWERKIREKVFQPVLKEMKARGTPYRGLLYAGLMIHGDQFWVLEFNARFGDPETQVLLPRMEGDIVPWLLASAEGTLSGLPGRVPFERNHGAYVVLASRGYPERPVTGSPIQGLPDHGVFLASVVRKDADLLTSGGRVLGALGLGQDPESARTEAYRLASQIRFEGAQFRSDIGGNPPRARIVVLASGRGSNFEALAREAREPSYPGEIVCLVSNRENAPALEKARGVGIPVRVTRGDEDLTRTLQELKPDVIVLAGYMKILPATLIERFRLPNGKSRILNIHPSLLPDLPGMNSYRRAFEEKREKTGVTVHEVEAEVDSGPILAQEAFFIRDFRNPEDVEKAGLAIEHRLFPAAIRSWILQNWRPHAEKI